MADFELLGSDGDETRILRDRASGFSVPLVGHPMLAPVPAGDIRYDVVVKLGDVEVEHGVRIDDIPSTMSPAALAAVFATAYAKNRAGSATVTEIPAAYIPEGASAGARAQYRIGGSGPAVERVWVVTKPSPTGAYALYLTTRANLDGVSPIHWAHLLSTMNGQLRWGGESPRAPIWPASELAHASARLELVDTERAEAVRKATELGAQPIGPEVTTYLSRVAQTDDPPATPVATRLDAIRGQLAPLPGGDVLVRNLDRCRTALDLRAWAWQCVWAIGNAQR